MSTKVALIYEADAGYGGWATYTAHLYHSMKAMGLEPHLFCMGRKVENRSREFGYGMTYQNIVPAVLRTFGWPVIMTAISKKEAANVAQWLPKKSIVILHDPNEMHPDLLAAIDKTGSKVVVIRKQNFVNLDAKGIHSVFIRHPYVQARSFEKATVHSWRACSISRLDWDKNIHIIAEANKILHPDLRVQIWGSENTMYSHHKLDQAFPGWRAAYRGKFPKEPLSQAVLLAGQGDYVVDMSTIAGDGGGTQYTFLEAWDAGANLIVHKKWLLPDDDMVAGENCLATDDGGHLAALISEEPDPRLKAAGHKALDRHIPEIIVPQYAQLWT